MTRAVEGSGRQVDGPTGSEDKRAAGAVIGAHTLQHFYQHGFFVILPEIYQSLGMTPVAAGVLETVRRVSGGVASMGGGFALDRFPERRIPLLYLSLMAMGLGYMAIGLAPSYTVILLAIGVAGAAGSVWHPAALGLLSQVFPQRRGFMISMHRSSGSFGDFIGPVAVGGLLVVLSWQTVLLGAVPLAIVFALALWIMLLRAPSWKIHRAKPEVPRTVFDQFRDLSTVVRSRGLLLLLVVAAFSGLGQGGVVMWLGLYLSQTQDMGSVGIGIHIALLTGFGIVAGPMIGSLSDRIGRKPVIAGVMAAKATFAAGMAITGSGLLFTLSVALLGAVMFGTNSLIQAAALDLADGRQLEGSMIGMLWGFNAMFTGVSPLIVGLLVSGIGYGIIFWFVAAVNVLGLLSATLMPALEQPSAASRG